MNFFKQIFKLFYNRTAEIPKTETPKTETPKTETIYNKYMEILEEKFKESAYAKARIVLGQEYRLKQEYYLKEIESLKYWAEVNTTPEKELLKRKKVELEIRMKLYNKEMMEILSLREDIRKLVNQTGGSK